MHAASEGSIRPAPPASPAPSPAPRVASLVTLRRAAAAALGLYALALLANVAVHPGEFQWDLKVYLAAARAHAAGLDPYVPANLARAGGSAALPFVYPPFVLPVFALLAGLPQAHAQLAYLALQVAALAALARVSARHFLGGTVPLGLVALALLGYNFALHCDVAAGNVTLFEQLALWSAFACLLRSRVGAFCALVAVAACVKLTPLAFLALPLAMGERRALRPAALAVAAVAALHAAALLVAPELELSWLRHLGAASGHGAGGDVNPSTLGLASRAGDLAARWGGAPLGRALALGAYGLAAAYVLARTARAFRARSAAGDDASRRVDLVVLACLAYALVMPRMPLYQYVLLLAPTYLVARRARGVDAAALLVGIACAGTLQHPRIAPPGVRTLVALALEYFPLALAAGAWALHARALEAEAGGARARPARERREGPAHP